MGTMTEVSFDNVISLATAMHQQIKDAGARGYDTEEVVAAIGTLQAFFLASARTVEDRVRIADGIRSAALEQAGAIAASRRR